MRQRLSLDEMFEDARRRVLHEGYDGTPPLPSPEAPWFTLGDLLEKDAGAEDVLARAPRP